MIKSKFEPEPLSPEVDRLLQQGIEAYLSDPSLARQYFRDAFELAPGELRAIISARRQCSTSPRRGDGTLPF